MWLKALKMGRGALLANLFGVRTPLNVMVSVTNRCLSRCSYCRIPERQQREMTTEEIQNLFDQMKKLGTVRVGLWGGEPLVRKDIGKIIDHARFLDFYVSLDTNGYLVPQRLSELAGLDHIVVALDGDEAHHDANREPGSFKKAMAAIEALAERKMHMWTITVLTRNNLDQIEYVLGVARQFGFRTTFQLIHHNIHLGQEMKGFLPDADADYRAAVRRLLEYKRAGEPIASSTGYLKHLLAWPDYSRPMREVRGKAPRCWAGRLYCNVDTDGTIYPCSLLIGLMKGENAIKVGFKAAFEAIGQIPCQACDASCFTEYNQLYSLHLPTIWEWMHAVREC